MLDHKKHLRVDGVLFQRHPETGKPWTAASAEAFLEALANAPAPVVDAEPETPVLTQLDMTQLITSISGAGLYKHTSDYRLITGYEGKQILIAGDLGELAAAVPDRTYSGPLRKSGGGYLPVPIVVSGGKFTIDLSLPAEEYHFGSEEINRGFDNPLFELLQEVQIEIWQAAPEVAVTE